MRAIGKDVAQMPVASVAMHLGPAHEKTSVFLFAHHLGVQRLIKRRPACATVKFVALIEQRRVAALAPVSTRIFREIVISEGPFCAVFAQDLERQIIQLCAPFRVRLYNLIHLKSPLL